jgi:hypothetical protein
MKYKANFILCLSNALALNFGHIKPFFAFASDTGDQPYESCVFGEFCNVISLFVTMKNPENNGD